MKALLIVLVLACNPLFAQNYPGNLNLVPNGGFEFGFAGFAAINDTSFSMNTNCWVKATLGYYPGVLGSPNQPLAEAHSGGAYLQLLQTSPLYSLSPGSPPVPGDTTIPGRTRPYPQCKLLAPLVQGVTYHFTMYVSGRKLDPGSSGSNRDILGNIGVYFSTEKVSNYTGPSAYDRIGVTPQLNFISWTPPAAPFTLAWQKLSGTYTANGGEQYMTIGNFDSFRDFNWLYLSSGSYSMGHTDPATSIFVDDVSLVSDTTQPLLSLSVFSLGNDTILCPGQTMTIGGQPNFFHYLWNTGDTTRNISVSSPGAYWCRVDFGCNSYTDTIRLTAPQLPQFDIHDTALCAGQSYTVSGPQGPFSYLWSTGNSSGVVVVGSPGTYWLRLSAAQCGLSVTDTFTISQSVVPVIPFDLPDTAICTGEVYTAVAPNGTPNLLWSTGATSQSISISAPGIYWLRLFNDCSGLYTDTFTVDNKDVPLPLPAIPDTMLCKQGTVFTYVLPPLPAGLNYLWSTGGTTASERFSAVGSYWVRITNSCGTTQTDSFRILAPAELPFSITDTTVCAGSPVSVKMPAGAASYLWSSGSTAQSTVMYRPGLYWGSAINACGNAFTDTFEVIDLTAQVVRPALGPDTFNCFADHFSEITLAAAHPSYTSILWSTGENASAITAKNPGYYWVQAGNLCITYRDSILLKGCPPKEIPHIVMPTAFSPNGDGRNDIFRVPYPKAQLVALELRVYNRWGQCLAVVRNVEDGWDGRNCDAGVYFYSLEYRDSAGFEHRQKGDVTLIR